MSGSQTAPLRLEFVTSATGSGQLPKSAAEVAFVGRSNVGKSSLINALANTRQLARVSSTPGRTQLINLFRLVGASGRSADRDRDRDGDRPLGRHLVDLPGYGYAKVPGRVRRDWPEMIEGYLLGRESLVQVYVLIDGEIGPTPLDVQMLDWLRAEAVPHSVVATKWDKVKSSRRQTRLRDLARGCHLEPGDVVTVSATTGAGIERLRQLVRLQLD